MCPCGLRVHKISFISSRTFFLKIILFIFACAGSWLLHGLFSSCGKQGLLFVAMHGLLIVGGLFFVVEHRFQGTWASVVVARGL